MVDIAHKGEFRDQTIAFLHTGGSVGLFGYDFAFDGQNRRVNL